jgi:MFS family permease
MFVWSPSLTWLILSRTLAGVFAANISTAQAYIADVYPPEKRSKGMGLVGAAFGLGFTLGPALGALLATLGEWMEAGGHEGAQAASNGLGLHLPIYVAMGLSFVAFLLAAFRLPESLTPELRATARARERVGRFRLLRQALGQPLLGSLLIGFFTVTFGFAVLEQLYSEFTRGPLGMSKAETGIAFTVVGLTIVVMQGGLIGRLTKKFGPWRLVFMGVVLEGITLFLFGMVGSMGMLLLASVGLAAGNSLCNPSILALISRNTPSDQQGGSMGLSAASSAMGRVLGPVLGGLIWGLYGPTVTFACGGVVVLLALPFLIRAHRLVGPEQTVMRAMG